MPWRERLNANHDLRKSDLLWRERQVVKSPQGPRVVIGPTEYLNFCSNDYLGLANHPELIESVVQAVRHRGSGAGASHLICGHSDEHQQLEKEIADFVGAENAIVFSTAIWPILRFHKRFLADTI